MSVGEELLKTIQEVAGEIYRERKRGGSVEYQGQL